MALICALGLFFFLACNPNIDNKEIDKLNSVSYAFHYRNLDSTAFYANKALSLSADYPTGKAEAYNNLAFVSIARMDYDTAYRLLDSVALSTDNQIELLIADIQYMRLCQRESRNKNFYDYREKALKRFKRIYEEHFSLSDYGIKRMTYAESEFAAVSSTYYYYVGLTRQSKEALKFVDPLGDIQKDTAQYLNYLYQVGSGGIINAKYKNETAQAEFEHLFKCYILAKRYGFVYWEANALQSISEHLLSAEQRKTLIKNNQSIIRYINEDNMPDSLLSGYLAQKSLKIFLSYGDIYQIAGAYRTLSFCYWELGDYTSSLICLEHALSNNKLISQAPDLVASIREQLSLVYSAMDDKKNSDINRNIYLDLQEKTRQDRQLEARAEQLEQTSSQLNALIIFIVVLIIILVMLLLTFKSFRKKKSDDNYIDNLLRPLHEWEEKNRLYINDLDDKIEDVNERHYTINIEIEKGKRRYVDNRAKIFIVNNVMPYIDRISNEVKRLARLKEPENVRNERFVYMAEITDKINEYNDVLTSWIQLQQGQLSLRIESFNIGEVFDILSKSAMSFRLKGIELDVRPSELIVKADKTLTLFMLNTLADNSRKFTPVGGRVEIMAEDHKDYVEVSVKDTGTGLTREELDGIFEHKVNNGHGFGLMNCKGVIDKYRKVSRIFSVCGLFVESRKGEGSRFFFRLPHGLMRMFVIVSSVLGMQQNVSADKIGLKKSHAGTNNKSEYLSKAAIFADSAYYSNINGSYDKTLCFVDTARYYLNLHYKKNYPNARNFMLKADNGLGVPAEIKWFRDKVNTDYDIILDIRNEGAVAALALHEWDLYHYNNKVYTQLFKENSADKGLAEYCVTMQRSSTNKTIAVMILVLLFIIILCSYYFLYYRHILFFRFCVEQVNGINGILLSDVSDKDKLERIRFVDVSRFPQQLKDVVAQIKEALCRSMALESKQKFSLELAEDELHRSEYEVEKLYICNNVIDNCLSTLKHETMYYPSRIRQLVDNADKNIPAISEVVDYYKELYGILCEQVRRQADSVGFDCRPISLKSRFGLNEYLLGDEALLKYMFDIIRKQCGIKREDISISLKGYNYVVFDVICREMRLNEQQCRELFTPSVSNIPFLICRQIVREISEMTNLHGCGIEAEPKDGVGTILHITLAKAGKSVRKQVLQE